MSATVRVGAFVVGLRNGKVFQVTLLGEDARTFDSFECAIHALAPRCGNCGVRVIEDGVEVGGRSFCCVNCAGQADAEGVAGRA